MDDTTLRAAILALLGPRPTPSRRRELADLLTLLATEQLNLAAADERLGVRVRAKQAIAAHNKAQKTGRPKGSGARFLRFEEARRQHTPRLHIGRALWQELGEPKRLDPQRQGTLLVLRPCDSDAGYAVTRPINGMPRIGMGQETADALRLVEGRYDARIEAGAIAATIP